MKPDFRTHFLRGIAHFNAREFWDAHEAWEEIWLGAESDVEQYLQGLIQLAAAYHHMKRGTFRGGIRLFESAARRLSQFPDPYCGLDRSAAVAAARLHTVWAADLLARGESEKRIDQADYPQLRLTGNYGDVNPPFDAW